MVPVAAKAAAVVFLVPFCWNVLARANHTTRWLNGAWAAVLGGGSEHPRVRLAAAYSFAAAIFAASFYRDVLFGYAVQQGPVVAGDGLLAALLALPAGSGVAGFTWDQVFGGALGAVGMFFVLCAYWRLGIVGTYLGDYCGVLMAAPVTGFPYNVLASPMYSGSLSVVCWSACPSLAETKR